MSDFLFRGDLRSIDPAVADLINHETARQIRKLILIASESTVPEAVREALMSPLHNLYAEGYPDPRTRKQTEEQILDYDEQLGYYRRYGDPRYYKGVEYADIIEALARRRCAECFATDQYPAGAHLRQRAAAVGRARQQRRVRSAGQTRRCGHGHVAHRGRPPDARLARQPIGQALQDRLVRCRSGDRAIELRHDPRTGAGQQAQDDHRGLHLVSLRARLAEVPRHRR